MILPTETAEDAEMTAIRKPGKQETAERGTGELATQGLQVERPLLWAPLVRRAEDCAPYLLVRDCSTRRAGKMDDFEAVEADFAAYNSSNMFLPPCLVSFCGFPVRIEIFRVSAVALTFEEFHCHERIEKICDVARMQVKFIADLRICEPALTECAKEIERNRSQQDLGIPEAERSLQNCVRCWRRCLHKVVDVANLPGVTSDDCMEKKIDSLRFVESRIRRVQCELARKKCAECEANHLDGAINFRQRLSIDFLRSAF